MPPATIADEYGVSAGMARPTNRQSISARRQPHFAPTSERQSDAVPRLREWLDRYKHRRARRAGWTKSFIKTGLKPLDAALPQGGLPNGAVTEIYSEAAGVGAMTLAFRIAERACGNGLQAESLPKTSLASHRDAMRIAQHFNAGYKCTTNIAKSAVGTAESNLQSSLRDFVADFSAKSPSDESLRYFHRVLPGRYSGTCPKNLNLTEGANRQVLDLAIRASIPSRAIVFVDTWGDFYPPAVARFGLDPERLIVIRSVNKRDAFWAVDQCLRCPAVAAVIAPLSRLGERESRRLQLAAESSGAIGLLLRSDPPHSNTTQTRSFAAVRLHIEGINQQSTNCRSRTASDNSLSAGSTFRFIDLSTFSPSLRPPVPSSLRPSVLRVLW